MSNYKEKNNMKIKKIEEELGILRGCIREISEILKNLPGPGVEDFLLSAEEHPLLGENTAYVERLKGIFLGFSMAWGLDDDDLLRLIDYKHSPEDCPL
jgi:hypothetical protein